MMVSTVERDLRQSATRGLFAWQHSIAVALLLLSLFLIVPVPFEHKAHHLLHGLCAQRPSHSFQMGGNLLPVDARMTGIYGGFLFAFLAFATMRGLRRAKPPGLAACGVLAGMLALMAIDGFNALLFDVLGPYLYVPDNRLRLLTGSGTGVVLAIALLTLLGMTIWNRPQYSVAVVDRWWEPVFAVCCTFPLLLVLMSLDGIAYPVICLALITAALIVFSTLGGIFAAILARRENSLLAITDLDVGLAVSLLIGCGFILALAGIRFGLEQITGAPPLT